MLLKLGLAVRAVLLLVGAWQDAHGQVKFTDIDYEVVTDGAARMAKGGSPFERSTYRYTPLLAAALVPNVTLHKAFGKLLFCAADLLAAW
jgi:phosphatidylinositol glycan class M